jgi:UDP-2-acetamido-3-amino-2,3-dideoxy-glucuronate N-acetyltransferase
LNDFYQHPNAIVESKQIGSNTRIWAFVHILPKAIIGANCNICDHVYIENDVILGDRVTVKCGVQLWDGIRLEDDVFVGPNATFTNDSFPRSKKYPQQFEITVVRQGASIGANATLLPGLVIGQHAMVGAGSVVTRDVPPHAVVTGNPARIVGYGTDRHTTREKMPVSTSSVPDQKISVLGVQLIELPYIRDLRGSLSVTEIEKDLPFIPQRIFWVFNVPGKEVRGEHSHRTTHQVLICVHGSCSVMVDDGIQRMDIPLESPNLAIYIPAMIWNVHYNYSADAVMLVLASEKYDSSEYIRDYDEFLKLVSTQGAG